MLRALNTSLTALELAVRPYNFEGSMDAVVGASLMLVNVHNNTGMCGMVPPTLCATPRATLPVGAQLGRPCGCITSL
jgi:hypothetical protein